MSNIQEILHLLVTTLDSKWDARDARFDAKFQQLTNTIEEHMLKPSLSAVGPSTDTASSNSSVNVTVDVRRRL